MGFRLGVVVGPVLRAGSLVACEVVGFDVRVQALGVLLFVFGCSQGGIWVCLPVSADCCKAVGKACGQTFTLRQQQQESPTHPASFKRNILASRSKSPTLTCLFVCFLLRRTCRASSRRRKTPSTRSPSTSTRRPPRPRTGSRAPRGCPTPPGFPTSACVQHPYQLCCPVVVFQLFGCCSCPSAVEQQRNR